MRKALKITECGILCAASVVGKTEKNGPLGGFFDLHGEDDRFGQKTWEKAEAEMQRMALNTALAKGGLHEEELDAILAGDLLNQCVGAAYGLKDFDVPYLGLYGACSTAAEGLLLAALLTSSGQLRRAAAVASFKPRNHLPTYTSFCGAFSQRAVPRKAARSIVSIPPPSVTLASALQL